MFDLSIVTQVAIAHDYLQHLLTDADRQAFWASIRDKSIDLGLRLYTLGPRYPVAYMSTNFGVTSNSGFIASCISFYEYNTRNTSLLMGYATGTFTFQSEFTHPSKDTRVPINVGHQTLFVDVVPYVDQIDRTEVHQSFDICKQCAFIV
jgi:hypothetical protein